MGVVYKAENPRLHRCEAFKFLARGGHCIPTVWERARKPPRRAQYCVTLTTLSPSKVMKRT